MTLTMILATLTALGVLITIHDLVTSTWPGAVA